MPYLDTNDLRFHVQVLRARRTEASSRPKVVMIHGLIVADLASYYFTIAHPVARVADTYLYDLRGNGKTEVPPSGYSIADHVGDLRSLLSAWQIDEPVHLVATSFGGTIALAFTRRHPELVASLVMVDTLIDAHVPSSTGPASTAHTDPGTLTGRRHAYLDALSTLGLSETTANTWVQNHGWRKQRSVVRLSKKLYLKTSFFDDLRREQPFPEQALRAIECPVLAIYGERSDILDCAHILNRHVARCELHLVPGCSHFVISEATPFVLAKTTEWLGRFAAELPTVPMGPRE